MARILLLLMVSFIGGYGQAQTWQLTGKISDVSGRPLAAGSVQISPLDQRAPIDSSGRFLFADLPRGNYRIICSHIGYQTETREIRLTQDIQLDIVLLAGEVNIDEIYVTATESKDLATSSVIDRKAMELLQPSSFTDILELLPGGRSVDPDLTRNNSINLRDADPISTYRTNSLGTQFSVDGAMLNSPASLGTLSNILGGGSQELQHLSRDNTFSGIDMRSISTDNIEKVEIIRGIASVEHGNLTSGAVLMERIKGDTPWSARLKADGVSKLFSFGKGFAFPTKGYSLNIDGGYLHANDDPTDIYTTFKRINSSIRGEKSWKSEQLRWKWGHSLDFNTTIDGDRFDPDLDYAATDRYTSTKRHYALSNKLSIQHDNADHPFQSLDLSANIQLHDNRIEYDKWTQTRSATLLMNVFEPGSHEVPYLTPSYVAEMRVTDRPMNSNVKAVSNWRFDAAVSHGVKLGMEHNYSKNLGAGHQFDINLPPSSSGGVRPRRFDKIPAYSNLAAFVEDRFAVQVGTWTWENSIGLRAFMLTNVERRYTKAGNVNLEPRWNSRLHLPHVNIEGKPLRIALTGGYGQQAMAPTLAYLYPDDRFTHRAELNYFHNNPAYRRAQAHTTVIDPTNYQLTSATSKKWELGTDIDFGGNRLTVTYFRDRLRDGFRSTADFLQVRFNKYDNTSVDPNQIDAKPELTDFDYEEVGEYYTYSRTTNGSVSDKEGLEYQFTSARIKGVNTRFTVNGAWFKTRSYNGQPLPAVIASDVITDGRIREYVALYQDVEGFDRRQFNTNLMADTYLPRLGLNFAAAVQTVWWSSSRTLPRSDLPIGYYDIDEQFHAYTEADRTHPVLRHFDKKTDPISYRTWREAIDLRMNLKATKRIKDKIRVAMFINRLLVYTPDYVEHGTSFYRQEFSTPYFGMELNVTL